MPAGHALRRGLGTVIDMEYLYCPLVTVGILVPGSVCSTAYRYCTWYILYSSERLKSSLDFEGDLMLLICGTAAMCALASPLRLASPNMKVGDETSRLPNPMDSFSGAAVPFSSLGGAGGGSTANANALSGLTGNMVRTKELRARQRRSDNPAKKSSPHNTGAAALAPATKGGLTGQARYSQSLTRTENAAQTTSTYGYVPARYLPNPKDVYSGGAVPFAPLGGAGGGSTANVDALIGMTGSTTANALSKKEIEHPSELHVAHVDASTATDSTIARNLAAARKMAVDRATTGASSDTSTDELCAVDDVLLARVDGELADEVAQLRAENQRLEAEVARLRDAIQCFVDVVNDA